jgi:hypothetical protein
VVDFEERMLAQMRDIRAGLPAEAQEEVMKSNIEPVEKLIANYRLRLEHLEHELQRMGRLIHQSFSRLGSRGTR